MGYLDLGILKITGEDGTSVKGRNELQIVGGQVSDDGEKAVLTVLSGDTSVAECVSTCAVGDVLCSANDPDAPTNLTKATDAAVAASGPSSLVLAVSEVASAPANVTYANAGDRVSAEATGVSNDPDVDPFAGIACYGILDLTTSRVVRSVQPLIGDYVLGTFDEAGNLALTTPYRYTARGFNVKDFGAKGDGITDDYAAVKRAIDALPPIAYSGEVFWPRGSYKYSRPVLVGSAAVKHALFQETVDSCVHSDKAFDGPIFAVMNKAYGNIPKGASLVGTGKSAIFHEDETRILQLSDIRAAKTLNGLAAFSFETFVHPTAATLGTYYCIASSSGKGTGADTITFVLFLRNAGDANLQIYGYINIDGVYRTVSLDNKAPLNATTYVCLNFNGTEVTLLAGAPGVMTTSATAGDTSAGTIVQADKEEVYLGILSQGTWPAFNAGYGPFEGYMGPVRMSKVSRHTANFTAPSTPFDFDDSTENSGKTLVGINWDLDAPNVDDEVDPADENTDVFTVGCSWTSAGGAKRPAYFMFKPYSGQNHTARVAMRNIHTESTNGVGTHWFWTIGSDLENYDCINSWRGARFENNCFQTKVTKFHCRADYIGLSMEGVTGLSEVHDLHIDVGKYPVAIAGNFDVIASRWYIVTSTMWNPIFTLGSTNASFTGTQISIATENMNFADPGEKRMQAAFVASNVRVLKLSHCVFEVDQATDNNPPVIELHNSANTFTMFEQCRFQTMAYNAGVNADQCIFAFTGTVGGKHCVKLPAPKNQASVPWLIEYAVDFRIEEEERGGFKPVTLVNADKMLTAEEGLYGTIVLVPDGTTPPTGPKNVTAPHITGRQRTWINKTTQDLTIKTPAGTGITIAAGKSAILIDDGTNQTRVTGDA